MLRFRRWLESDVKRKVAFGSLVIAVTTLIPAAQVNVYWLQVFLLVNLYIGAAISLNLLRGEAGQVSFGQGAIFGVGAYSTAMFAAKANMPIGLAIVLGVLVATFVGLLLSLPALRVQGYYLGFITLAAAIVFPDLLFAFNEQTDAITGISVSATGLKDPTVWRFSPLTLIITAFAILTLVAHGAIRGSRLGRKMRVSAASPEAALTMGISPGKMRVSAFVLASIGTGIAGALYVPLLGFVSPGAFPLFLSIFLYFSVVVGGQGNLLGPIAGVYLLHIVPNVLLVDLARYRLLMYGGIAFLIMMFFPDGLIGSIETGIKKLRRSKQVQVSIESIVGPDPSAEAHSPAQLEDSSTAPPAIVVDQVSKGFGQVKALNEASIQVQTGTIHGLVGPNGSGKTTLLNSLSGLITTDHGQISIAGRDITGMHARKIAEIGVGRTFQTPVIFEDLTLWENVDVQDPTPGALSGWMRQSLERVRSEWEHLPSDNLPHAQRRLLEIVRVLSASPKVLLLDEPAAGLSTDERASLGQILKHLAASSGTTVLLVEHDLNLVWQVADAVSVMDEGHVILSGTPDEVMESSAVEMLFAGGNVAEG